MCVWLITVVGMNGPGLPGMAGEQNGPCGAGARPNTDLHLELEQLVPTPGIPSSGVHIGVPNDGVP